MGRCVLPVNLRGLIQDLARHSQAVWLVVAARGIRRRLKVGVKDMDTRFSKVQKEMFCEDDHSSESVMLSVVCFRIDGNDRLTSYTG